MDREFVERMIRNGVYLLMNRGYLYSLKDGKVRCQEGNVYKKAGDYRYNRVRIFIREDYSHVKCAVAEGEIYNGYVWLTEKNDRKAINIMLEHERLRISKLKEQINNHEERIEALLNNYCGIA